MSKRTAAIVLAAGQGTRMRSPLAKVLHPVLGRPMVAWIVGAALEAGCDRVVTVVGVQADAVEAALRAAFPGAPLAFAVQREQHGTGHAVQCAMAATEGCDELLVLSGDTPALDAATISALRERHAGLGAALTVTTFEVDDAAGYGRIVREGGAIARVVEHRDAGPDERAIREVNAGLYAFARPRLAAALAELRADNAQGELYLTDVVATLSGEGAVVGDLLLTDPFRVAGVNTRAQLAALEDRLLRRRLVALMESGVTIQSPASVRIEIGVEVGADSVIGPQVQLLGATRVGAGCRIDAGCVLTDCTLADGVHLKPYVVATEATLGDDAVAGPFTHLRPGTRLGPRTKVGNFVETKKAVLGEGSKASHLSYLGDCEVGREVNIGAGTITCNYDGFDKHRTVLADGVFIGSDTQLVAPVTVGDNALVGAGTTVTKDVPAGALAVSRAPQQNIEGYYDRYRRARAEAKRRAKGGKG